MFDIFNMLKKEEHKDAKQVTRETIIGDILDMDQTTAPYFMEIGMHCLGCPASRGESIEEACAVLWSMSRMSPMMASRVTCLGAAFSSFLSILKISNMMDFLS